MNRTETERAMHDGSLYCCTDPELIALQMNHRELLEQFNRLPLSDQKAQQALLRQMFAEFGEDNFIERPLHANWGGRFVHFGSSIYANFNLTLVDDTHIYVEDHVMFGPNVTLCAGTHPVSPRLRQAGVQYNLPVRICKNAWLGAGVIVMPGVTIGENTVIGAGSVVTENIPANVVAVGSPCRVLRSITEADERFYDRTRPVTR